MSLPALTSCLAHQSNVWRHIAQTVQTIDLAEWKKLVEQYYIDHAPMVERSARLDAALEQFEPEAVEMLLMHFRDGYSDAEIAAEFQMKRTTAMRFAAPLQSDHPVLLKTRTSN